MEEGNCVRDALMLAALCTAMPWAAADRLAKFYPLRAEAIHTRNTVSVEWLVIMCVPVALALFAAMFGAFALVWPAKILLAIASWVLIVGTFWLTVCLRAAGLSGGITL